MAYRSAYYTRLINTTRWRHLRAQVLTAHPYCEECEKQGVVTPATVVHHREPVEGAHSEAEQAALMYNPGNLEALCRECHKAIHLADGYNTKARHKERKQLRVDEAVDAMYGDAAAQTPGGIYF